MIIIYVGRKLYYTNTVIPITRINLEQNKNSRLRKVIATMLPIKTC